MSTLQTWRTTLRQYTLSHSPSGKLTFRDSESGEYLHRFFGPVQEAEQVYAQPSGAATTTGRMRICDLGLGGGFNVLETLKAAAHNPHLEELELYSFDLHTQGVALLIDSITLFPELLAWVPVLQQVRAAAQTGAPACFRLRDICPAATSPAAVKWTVLLGDAFERIATLPETLEFDAIFYDMFSWQSAPQLWTRPAFEKFVSRMTSNGVLMTYSTATPVRAVLLSFGCWVGEGAFVSTKMRSTIASKDPRRILEPLPPDWIVRFRRSGRPFFETEAPENRSLIFDRVVNHPQFSSK